LSQAAREQCGDAISKQEAPARILALRAWWAGWGAAMRDPQRPLLQLEFNAMLLDGVEEWLVVKAHANAARTDGQSASPRGGWLTSVGLSPWKQRGGPARPNDNDQRQRCLSDARETAAGVVAIRVRAGQWPEVKARAQAIEMRAQRAIKMLEM
jgi:hypothetical protein